MIQLSEVEEAILKFWRGYIRTNGDKSVRPATKYLWKWKEIFMTLRTHTVKGSPLGLLFCIYR